MCTADGITRSASSADVALAHHWLMSMRGGEKTVSALASEFPAAPIYTLLARRAQLDGVLSGRDIRCSFLQRFGVIPNLQRKALPLLATAARSLDATDHDVVICSDAAIVKAIRTRPDALKLCYCHSPMRYVWDLYDEYRARSGFIGKVGLRLFAPKLREADRAAADTVDAFVANSRHVADRIRRHYGRTCVVIWPPVNVDRPPPVDRPDEFYLVLSELVHYKRVDLAVEACTALDRPLTVIGTGPLMPLLRARAGACVRFLGWQSDDVVRDHLRRCKALLFCGEEDFGLTPVEAMAAGRPVIAYRAGGATETVLEDLTGAFFDEPTLDSLAEAIRQFEQTGIAWPSEYLQQHARQFSTDAFHRRFRAFYDWCLTIHRDGGAAALRNEMQAVPVDRFTQERSDETGIRD